MNKIVFLPLIENIYKGVQSLYDDTEYHLILSYFLKTIFIINAAPTNINANVEWSGVLGLRILLNDSIKAFRPAYRTIIENTIALKYSIR